MILIGLGANLPTRTYGPPRATLGAALCLLEEQGYEVCERSPWYESAPVPISDQPWFVNGVCQINTREPAEKIIKVLLGLENRIGRVRTYQNAARIIDLDLLAYDNDIITANEDSDLSVPHPRMYGRSFVMLPLADIAPNWIDPVSGRHVNAIVADLSEEQVAKKMPDADGVHGTEWRGTANSD